MLIKMFTEFIKVDQFSHENRHVKANLHRPMYATIGDKKLNWNLNDSHSLKRVMTKTTLRFYGTLTSK